MMAAFDRDALLALFHATDGAKWRRHDKWGTDAKLRLWYGVEVNDQGRVVTLDLADDDNPRAPSADAACDDTGYAPFRASSGIVYWRVFDTPKLGAGMMGGVYHYKDHDGEDYAMKLSHARWKITPQMHENEARVQALMGLHVADVYDDQEQQSHFLMKLVHGRPLRQVLDSLDEMAQQGQEMAQQGAGASGPIGKTKERLLNNHRRAVEEMHAKGLIHGDTHYNNAMADEDEKVTLIDFGGSTDARKMDDAMFARRKAREMSTLRRHASQEGVWF